MSGQMYFLFCESILMHCFTFISFSIQWHFCRSQLKLLFTKQERKYRKSNELYLRTLDKLGETYVLYKRANKEM